MNKQPSTATVNEILSYFLRNPQAADDLEGIARFRLLNEIVTRRVDETEQALAWLVLNGYLCETHNVGIRPIYSLNMEKAGEAKELLVASEHQATEQAN